MVGHKRMNANRLQAAKEFTLSKFASSKRTADHSFEVFSLLQDEFQVTDTDILTAGMMHDLLRDTDVTKKEIEDLASGRVLKLVSELTPPKEATEEQKNAFSATLVGISPRAKLVELASALANVRRIQRRLRSGAAERPSFVKESSEYLASLRPFLDSCKEVHPLETSTVSLALYEVEKALKALHAGEPVQAE